MPKVSVIIPVYNVEKYLPQCIDSILAQTFTDFELILVNDGSKDCSGNICDEYAQKDSRIVVIHKENGGASSARNRGLDIAKGEWISFIDSDDYVTPNYLSNLISEAQANCASLVIQGHIYQKKGSETSATPTIPLIPAPSSVWMRPMTRPIPPSPASRAARASASCPSPRR